MDASIVGKIFSFFSGVAMKPLRILTYNIHKGFSTGNRQFILQKIKESIKTVEADIVFLQEVIGEHEKHSNSVKNWPTNSQFEFLADQTWSHFAYGKNAVYQEGHHGNAILSKFPIISWSNEDISTVLESRGLLHAELEVPGSRHPVHVFCIHFGLFEKDRKNQILTLARKISNSVPADAPLIIAGDFNDWRENASDLLIERLQLNEVFLNRNGKHAVTFPAWLPLLALDRVYYRNLECTSAIALRKGMWSGLSDHLPILTELTPSSQVMIEPG